MKSVPETPSDKYTAVPCLIRINVTFCWY